MNACISRMTFKLLFRSAAGSRDRSRRHERQRSRSRSGSRQRDRSSSSHSSRSREEGEKAEKEGNSEQAPAPVGEPSNDDLFYDPNIDDDNERWVQSHRASYQQGEGGPLPKSDAVLNCPACMGLLCLDCQR